jgi:ribosomal-protein-alanine N-acetyltransferase
METAPQPPIVTTDRLVLRMPRPDRTEEVVAFFAENLEYLRPFQPTLPPDFVTQKFWRNQLECAWSAWRAGTVVRWFVYALDDPRGVPIGYVSLTSIKRGNCQSAELSYAIDRTHGGHGYMTEAVRAVIDYAWNTLGLHRLDAKFRADNRRSGALLERVGFSEIGVAPRFAEIDGQWRDHVLTVLVRD